MRYYEMNGDFGGNAGDLNGDLRRMARMRTGICAKITFT